MLFISLANLLYFLAFRYLNVHLITTLYNKHVMVKVLMISVCV